MFILLSRTSDVLRELSVRRTVYCQSFVVVLFTVRVIPEGRPRRRRHHASPAPIRTAPREYCRNCGIRTGNNIVLCQRCAALPVCRTCKRHLKPVHFNNNSDRCRACSKKVRGARHAGGAAVLEYDLEIHPLQDVSYDDFINENADIIRRIVDENRRQQR